MNKYDFSFISGLDSTEIAQNLLNHGLDLNLVIATNPKDFGLDLVQYSEKDSNYIDVGVDLESVLQFDDSELENIGKRVNECIKRFQLKRFILLSFETIIPENRDVLKLISKNIDIEFNVLDLDWISAQLDQRPEIVKKYNLDTSSSTTKTEKHYNLKHALSTEENDEILTTKGYSNQGIIGYVLTKEEGDSVPLYQVLLDENGVADYFAYIQEAKEDLNSFPISEKKLIGYVGLSGVGGQKLYRYKRENSPSDFDHFYCTNPIRDELGKYGYKEEAKNRFESTFILDRQIENSIPLFVYSNNSEIKFFNGLTEASKINLGSAFKDFKGNYYVGGSVWEGVDQTERFLKDHIWENGYGEGKEKLSRIVKAVKPNDLIFLKSSHRGKLRVKAVGRVNDNPGDGSILHVDWELQDGLNIDIPRLGKFGSTIHQVILDEDINDLLDAVGRKRIIDTGLLEVLNEDIPTLIRSKLSENSNFWWINAYKWIIDDLEIGGTESYRLKGEAGKSQKYVRQLKISDLLIAYQAKPNKVIVGIFRIADPAGKDERYHVELLYKFQNKTSLEDLKELPLFGQSSLSKTLQGSLHKLDPELFQEIIDTTELGPIGIDENENTQNESKIAQQIADTYKGEDYLGIDKDVTAFAKVIASNSFSPPLAIALFGQWGSGKSFFMNKLRDRIKELSDSKMKEYRAGIAQIHFNAWSYLDANLWASIVSRIFEGLNNYIKDTKRSDSIKKKIEEELSEKLNMIREERNLLELKRKERADTISALKSQKTKLKNNLNAKIQEVKKSSLNSIIEKVNSTFKIEEQITTQLSQKFDDKEIERIKTLVPQEFWDNPELAIKEVKRTKTFIQLFFRTKNIGWYLLLILLAIVSYVTVTEFVKLENGWVDSIVTQLKIAASSLAVLVPTWNRYKSTFDRLRPILSSFLKVKDEYDSKLSNAMFEHDQKMAAIKLQIDQFSNDLELAGNQIVEKENEIKELDFKLNNALSSQTLYSYIDERAQSEDYKKYFYLSTDKFREERFTQGGKSLAFNLN